MRRTLLYKVLGQDEGMDAKTNDIRATHLPYFGPLTDASEVQVLKVFLFRKNPRQKKISGPFEFVKVSQSQNTEKWFSACRVIIKIKGVL
jgi:hypothetical protein